MKNDEKGRAVVSRPLANERENSALAGVSHGAPYSVTNYQPQAHTRVVSADVRNERRDHVGAVNEGARVPLPEEVEAVPPRVAPPVPLAPGRVGCGVTLLWRNATAEISGRLPRNDDAASSGEPPPNERRCEPEMALRPREVDRERRPVECVGDDADGAGDAEGGDSARAAMNGERLYGRPRRVVVGSERTCPQRVHVRATALLREVNVAGAAPDPANDRPIGDRSVSFADGGDDVPVRQRDSAISDADDLPGIIDRDDRTGDRCVHGCSVRGLNVDAVVEVVPARITEVAADDVLLVERPYRPPVAGRSVAGGASGRGARKSEQEEYA